MVQWKSTPPKGHFFIMIKSTTSTKGFILNDKAKQVMLSNNVPEHLHRLTTALVICIITDIERKYELAKAVVDDESLLVNDKDYKLAQNLAVQIIS